MITGFIAILVSMLSTIKVIDMSEQEQLMTPLIHVLDLQSHNTLFPKEVYQTKPFPQEISKVTLWSYTHTKQMELP